MLLLLLASPDSHPWPTRLRMTPRLTLLPSLPRANGLLTWRWIRPLALMLPLTPLTGQGPAWSGRRTQQLRATERHTAVGRLRRPVGRKAREGSRNGTGPQRTLARLLAEYLTLPMAHTAPLSITTQPGEVSAADTTSVQHGLLAVTNASRRIDHNHHSTEA